MPLDIGRIRAAFPGRRIEYFGSIDSTMRAAASLETGGVVLAGEQTAGQGRLGRVWHSEAGAGIYCSIVLQPAPLLTLALGLAARSAILAASGLACDIRWPNDLMLGGRKVAGILVHADDRKAIAGIGINVNHTSFPPELANEATSLRIEWDRSLTEDPVGRTPWSAAGPPTGHRPEADEGVGRGPGSPPHHERRAGLSHPPSSTDFLLALLPAVDSFVQRDPDVILRLFAEASSYASGRRVTVRQPEGAIEGTTAGLDSSGFLIVRRDDGTDTLVLAGGVRAAGS